MTRYIQVFYGRCPPGSTEPRTVAVVWDEGDVTNQGPVEDMRKHHPTAIELQGIRVWLDLKSIQHFRSTYGNPLQ